MHAKPALPRRIARQLRAQPGSPEHALAESLWSQALLLAAPRAFALRLARRDFEALFGPHLDGAVLTRAALEGCPGVWVLAASIGPALEERARELFDAGEAFSGYALDLCGNLLADKALRSRMDAAKAQEPPGSRFTRRISPGYRDFPLAAQAVFAELTGAATGIACGAGMGLAPRKSLTALLGLLP
ncbi:hypothetical protein [Fundidesulfovibrio soli]|uniref:hypothetical protein n=1 Tax=Fundidesulfovibrio soli TaxID=2922716 RepID=UPI0023513FB4|nr:hypothetical protein [Fundidesulfovibrio soli]